MRAAISLLLLLLFMFTQTESQSTGAAAAEVSTKVDIFAELKELRDMVVERRVLLTITKTELQNTKTDMMKEVEKLKKENAAQVADLTAVKTRLAASEAEVMNLRKENAAQEADLTDLKTRLVASEAKVTHVESNSTPKVAFSAGLTDAGFLQAGGTDMNLVFSRVITNVGQAYSSTTGFFTAPVRGVYYFRVTVMDTLDSRWLWVFMYKNGQELLLKLAEHETHGRATYVSNGLTLQMEVGDVVNMRLKAGHRLYDNANNYNVFTGFLLFTL
ncbi:complement C1q-like protein 2 [Engraulis encrasicolus]|uniref:complement C1q-like protein 2 n=1 Tax=Engraulis encrasicolus TaxID=184585 RepID=UPI002FD6EF8B